MSVAYELDPTPATPEVSPGRRSSPAGPRRLTVVPDPAPRRTSRERVLAPPAPAPPAVLRPLDEPNPVRLTRRGVVVLAAAVAVLGAALVGLAAYCAPSSGASQAAGPAVVTVHPGDTLWSIASAAAPDTDPAAEVATIQRLNHLRGASLTPGEQLRVR